MKPNPEKELLVVVILGLVGLIFLWLQLPVSISMFNYLPLFLVSYIVSLFLPGYTFLSFIKPDLSFNTRLEMGIPLSLALLFLVTFLFLYLEIPQAFTYSSTVLMILSLLLAGMSYLAEKLGSTKAPPRKPKPAGGKTAEVPETYKGEKQVSTRETDEDALKVADAREEKGTVKPPLRRRRRLIPPEGEVEIIIPNHGQGPEEGKTSKDNAEQPVKGTSSGKPALKLPWLERQKELDRQKK